MLMKSIYLLICTLFFACNNPKKEESVKVQSAPETVAISYGLNNGSGQCNTQLYARVNGERQVLIDFDQHKFLYIQLQDDFNNDGFLDVLVENRKGCHSETESTYLAHEGSSYFIMAYDGQKFHMTNEVGKDWDGIEMVMRDGKLHIAIETAEERSYTYSDKLSCNDKEETFVLDNFKLKQVAVDQKTKMTTLMEMDCLSLIQQTSIVESYDEFNVDFNNDGYKDELRFTYYKDLKGYDNLYLRLATINPDIEINTQKRSVKRLGILASKTNGYNDLVINCDEIMSWNGEEYRYKNVYKSGNKYRVFAKNGLIIRDSPDGIPIGKFDYNAEITVIEKTEIEMDYEEEAYVTIEGYWYKVAFFDEYSNSTKQGFVFSGYLANLDYCSIFSDWNEVSISKNAIVYKLHGQCYYTYPVKIISETEVELIWSQDGDCVFLSGLDEDFALIISPEKGKPFAKFTLDGDTLKASYYYPDWVKEYNQKYPAIFSETYTLNYPSLIDY